MYQEKKLGPRTPLQHHRFNLIGLGLNYVAIGLAFHFLNHSRGEAGSREFLAFLLIGGSSVLFGLLTYRGALVARFSRRIHYAHLIVCTINFGYFAALRSFDGPYFAWSLVGPFVAAASMTVYNRPSAIVIYLWIAFGSNLAMSLRVGAGTPVYVASNLIMLAVSIPILMNIARMAQQAKEKRIRAVELALAHPHSGPPPSRR